jgi:hypothetical protein
LVSANLKGVRRAAGIVAAAAALLVIGSGSAQALTLEPVGSFDQPIFVASDPDDAGRLFVAEREGAIQLVEDGVSTEFVDLSSVVSCCTGERGLLSLALDPDFGANGRLYVFYTGVEDPGEGELHVAELTADPGHKTANLASLEDLIAPIAHSEANTHNGGQLQFGPDGHLYASTGDGGGSNDVFEHAQDPNDPLGKILRINPDAAKPVPYEKWSLGLRNPYRFSFDALSGDMVIADVGQSAREEIDFAPSPFPGVVGGQGANYGWNCREGFLPGVDPNPECASPPPGGFVDPVFDYPHTPDPDLGGSRCSVTGGYVVRDASLGALYGHYVYADYCAGVLRALQLPASAGGQAVDDCSLGVKLDNPVSFGEDALRQLYVAERGGDVYRFEGQPPLGCPPAKPVPPPPPKAEPQLSPTFVGIKAQRRRVERGKTAVLTVFVSPCQERKGDVVALHRNGRRNGSKFLSRACTARFLRRVHRNTVFTATTFADQKYAAGDSRRLRVKVIPRRR